MSPCSLLMINDDTFINIPLCFNAHTISLNLSKYIRSLMSSDFLQLINFSMSVWISYGAYFTSWKLYQMSLIISNNLMVSCAYLRSSYFSHAFSFFSLRKCIVHIWCCKISQVSHHFLLLDSHIFDSCLIN